MLRLKPIAGRFHLAEHPVERQGLLHDMRMVQQLGIRRHKIGNGVHLDAVPDMVDHRPMRVGGLVAEFFEGAAHGNEVEIVALDLLLKADAPLRGCHHASIVGGNVSPDYFSIDPDFTASFKLTHEVIKGLFAGIEYYGDLGQIALRT
jgi:hypothetical protein